MGGLLFLINRFMLNETITPKLIPSRSAEIENVFFGDGYYTFGLKIDQFVRLMPQDVINRPRKTMPAKRENPRFRMVGFIEKYMIHPINTEPWIVTNDGIIILFILFPLHGFARVFC